MDKQIYDWRLVGLISGLTEMELFALAFVKARGPLERLRFGLTARDVLIKHGILAGAYVNGVSWFLACTEKGEKLLGLNSKASGLAGEATGTADFYHVTASSMFKVLPC